MINRAVLAGRLTREPELRTTGNGIYVTQFTLAVNRPHYNCKESGADFISCVAWRKTAEVVKDFCHKGSLIGVDGRIQTRTYNNKNGEKVFITEVVADNISFLESKKDANSNVNAAANNNASEGPFEDNGSIEITDADLPF